MLYSQNTDAVCEICEMNEPHFWWLDEDINPSIREVLLYDRPMLPKQFYPSLWAALDAWGQTEGLTGGPHI